MHVTFHCSWVVNHCVDEICHFPPPAQVSESRMLLFEIERQSRQISDGASEEVRLFYTPGKENASSSLPEGGPAFADAKTRVAGEGAYEPQDPVSAQAARLEPDVIGENASCGCGDENSDVAQLA